jgi:hypothetical protein
MRARPNPIFKRFFPLLAAFAFIFGACQLIQDSKGEDTVSFTRLYDTLKQFDEVIIVMADGDGILLDTVYRGKVDAPAEIEGLPVKGWDGKKAQITIVGFKDGEIVYKIEKAFDGGTDKTQATDVLVTQGTSLSAATLEITLTEGDSAGFPEVAIIPSTLARKSLSWSSSDPEILRVAETHIKALKKGSAQLKAMLKSEPSKSLTFHVTIEPNGKIPETLALTPKDTLHLAAGGAGERFQVQAAPAGASNAVTWSSEDPQCASVAADGFVLGLRPCITKVVAVSKEKASVSAFAWVDVSGPVPVERVRFLKDSTELFIGGAAESLLVEVTPARANPSVEFLSSSPSKVAVQNGKITGLAEGPAFVFAVSKENPALTDTLKVTVYPSQRIDGISISPRSRTLYTGGEEFTFTAAVSPSSSPQKTRWGSSNNAVAKVDAAGKVSPVAPGAVRIFAVSLVDSSRKDSVDVIVKRDAPRLSVGQDTVVSLGETVSFLPGVAPQEYGVLTSFKWDLDGDLAWDDSAAALETVSYKYDQEKEYSARFYVRDSEGNDTIAVKKVKAVKGLVVLIVSPANNSYTNQTSIAVRWRIDGKEQDSLPKVDLKDGPNVITRTAYDEAHTPFSASITVYLDTVKPNRPLVHGPASSASALPIWTWGTGGAGGVGVYRCSLDNPNLLQAPETRDTVFSPLEALKEGAHTLYVQERDAAGNWSASGSVSILVDLSPPGAPNVTVGAPAVTNNQKPVWNWTGDAGGSGLFEYKLDNGNFSSGATQTPAKSFTPATNLGEGPHTLYVREKDSTGNWSPAGSAAVTIDITAPNAPKLSGATPTGVQPAWTWTSGGAGGSGDYRYKLGGDGNPAAGGVETRALTYTLAAAVSGTAYTLHIQERDEAGNWSSVSSLAVKYDLTKPTVTITAPQASGTYITTAAGVTLACGAAGPNAIAKVEYSVDGGAPAPAAQGGGGSWSTGTVALTDGKTAIVTLKATDALGNTGEASLSLLRDNTAPSAPASLSAPTSPTNAAKASWTWAAGSDGANGSGLGGQYRYNLGGAAWITTSAASATGLDLKEGSNVFSVQEQDKAGNWSASATNEVILDTKAPDKVTFSGTSGSYTASTTPTWTWSPSTTNPGIGVYVLKLDAGAEFDLASSASSVTYTPSTALSDNQAHTLTVKQKDQVAGVTGAVNSFTYNIKVNPAGAPAVKSAANVANSGATNNPKFTWTSGGGGTGTYRVRLNNDASYQTHPQPGGSQTEWSIPSNMADGAYTIRVSEQDQLNRWGNEGAFTINLDRTGPAITEVKVKDGNFALRDGFITNKASIVIAYKADGASKEYSCNLPNNNAANVCSFSETDGVGNKTTYSATVWKRNKVIFFKQGGIGDGSSWERATDDIASFVHDANFSGYDLWLGSGAYDAVSPTVPINLIGGFNAAAYPNTTSGRNKGNTFIGAMTVDFNSGGTFDGMTFTGDLSVRITTVTMIDCSLQGAGRLNVIDGGTVNATNFTATGLSGFYALVYVSGSTLNFNGGTISNNTPDEGGVTFWVLGKVNLAGGMVTSKNSTANSPYDFRVGFNGELTIDRSVTADCGKVSNESGTVHCKE